MTVPMNVSHDEFIALRHIQPFDADIIRLQICDQLKKQPDTRDELFEKRKRRYDDTIQYALDEAAGKDISRQEVIDRTVHSLNAEMGVAYILGGVWGVFDWLDNNNITFDVPTPGFNLEIKTSFAKWPTMHTAGAKPYGKSEGLCLYSGLRGDADVYLVLNINEYAGRITYRPNYFFTKRAMENYPYVICVPKRGGGAYVNRQHNKFVYFYNKWCTF
ncbi:hypothetical protein [Stenotrophomonas phage IME13]|uniref:Uncharacterized protein n=1 Tax=Stenotrophomonas phage IME13 TaxID=1211280 RepID=J7I492_9CAUD|nr:DenB-like DNA endonuclease IV [Stenotrophomonas phage IME13]AFQ22540.1 hypothetical protein [Stenotrophomonas phage IME13]